jgi:hypothetical protein
MIGRVFKDVEKPKSVTATFKTPRPIINRPCLNARASIMPQA